MFKLLKKMKLFKLLTIVLVAVFTINVTSGCTVDPNGVNGVQSGGGNKNIQLGVGNNVDGYLVYSQSTFDPMSKELLMGYLLNGRNFTLVVVPSTANDGDTDNYDSFDSSNYLFSSAQAGILQYDDDKGEYYNPEYKALMYYVTDKQLNSWFNEFAKNDNFLNNALEFTKETIDLEKGSRFKCEDLVNLGSGLNSDTFCNKLLKNEEISFTDKKGATVKRKVFANKTTGGIVLFFGFYSIEGYMTYHDIVNYEGSIIANTFDKCTYTVGDVAAFNLKELAQKYIGVLTGNPNAGGYGYRESVINDFINNKLTAAEEAVNQLKSDIISIHTEMTLGTQKGCVRLKTMYQLIEQALVTDYIPTEASNIWNLYNLASTKINSSDTSTADKDKYNFIYSTINMLKNFNEYAAQEAFNIKFSYGLFNRYSSTINTSENSNILGTTYSDMTSVTFDQALNLSQGVNKVSENSKSYLLLLTADGFTIDRGTDSDMQAMGAADMLGYSDVLQQLVMMDGCPNETLAAKMYNLFANLKIIAGTAIALTGAAVAAGAVIGLAIASVVSKAALVVGATPVPGARIVALVIAAIAGLIALGVGLVTLISGLNDRAKLKGMGASETNYCSTYKATVKRVLKEISLPVPVYTYEIPKDSSDSISLKFCAIGDYNEQNKQCEKDGEGTGKPLEVPLYYYANREESEKLSLEGMPILMYFNNNKLVDYIFGATTPEFIIEMIRVWGLLSAREIVYKSTISGKNIQIFHTSNKTARTVRINEMKYCFTFGYDSYERNLYDTTITSPCVAGETVGLNNMTSYSVDKPIKTVQVTSAMETDVKNSLSQSQIGVLAEFEKQLAYKVNQYVTSNFEIKNKEEVFKDSTISFSAVGSNVVTFLTVVPSDGEGDTSRYMGYMTKDKKYFLSYDLLSIGDLYSIESYEEEGQTKYKLYLIASTKEDLSMDDLLKEYENKFGSETSSNSSNEEFTLDNFIEYIAGTYEFKIDPSMNVLVPVYFTATIKENTQAKNDCKNEKYSYYRTGTLFGWFNGDRCLKDGDSNKNDIPNIGDEKMYTTSILIGDFSLYLDNKGVINVDDSNLWKYLGGN